MKTLHKTLLTFLFITISYFALAQDKDYKAMIDRGVALNDSGKYSQAIDKYNEVLKLDKDNLRAQYELAYTLSMSGRPKEAIPYLEKVAISNNYPGAYDLLGSIYDDAKDYEKAISYYKQGIIAFPKYERLRFNLAVSYQRQQKFAEAEEMAISAIKLDPKHASSQRIYALAVFYQNKRCASLLAWCSFLLLEPQTARSNEAYAYIRKILNYGITKTGDKTINVNVAPGSPENTMMPLMVLGATVDKKGLSPIDSVQLQLTSVFKASATLLGDKANPFTKSYFADYFNKLAETDNMPVFAHIVCLTAYRDENIKWFKENGEKLTALNNWITSTKREL